MIIAEEFSKWALSLKTSQITDKSKEVLKFLVKGSARSQLFLQTFYKAEIQYATQ